MHLQMRLFLGTEINEDLNWKPMWAQINQVGDPYGSTANQANSDTVQHASRNADLTVSNRWFGPDLPCSH